MCVLSSMRESSGAAPFGFKGADGDFFLVRRVSHAQPSAALLRASSSALYYFWLLSSPAVPGEFWRS